MEIVVSTSGPHQQQLADELRPLLEDAFGQAVRREERAADGAPMRDAATVIAVIALALSLPGAINEVITLAERAKLKQRLSGMM